MEGEREGERGRKRERERERERERDGGGELTWTSKVWAATLSPSVPEVRTVFSHLTSLAPFLFSLTRRCTRAVGEAITHTNNSRPTQT